MFFSTKWRGGEVETSTFEAGAGKPKGNVSGFLAEVPMSFAMAVFGKEACRRRRCMSSGFFIATVLTPSTYFKGSSRKLWRATSWAKTKKPLLNWTTPRAGLPGRRRPEREEIVQAQKPWYSKGSCMNSGVESMDKHTGRSLGGRRSEGTVPLGRSVGSGPL